MKKQQKIKIVTCPKCGSTNIARYSYGLPAFDKELNEKLESGEIVLGGCCIDIGDSPKYYCNDCEHDFGIYCRSKNDHSSEDELDEVLYGKS